MWTLYDMHLNKLLNSIVAFLFSHTSYNKSQQVHLLFVYTGDAHKCSRCAQLLLLLFCLTFFVTYLIEVRQRKAAIRLVRNANCRLVIPPPIRRTAIGRYRKVVFSTCWVISFKELYFTLLCVTEN